MSEEILSCKQLIVCVPRQSPCVWIPDTDSLLRALFLLGFQAIPPSVCEVEDHRVFSYEL
jgi:hypothetical protein